MASLHSAYRWEPKGTRCKGGEALMVLKSGSDQVLMRGSHERFLRLVLMSGS